jgi:short-chain fatty acids transporter
MSGTELPQGLSTSSASSSPAGGSSLPPEPHGSADDHQNGKLTQLAGRFTHWAERWIPDAFVFALLATIVVFAIAVARNTHPVTELLHVWGDGFWKLIPFTLQMAMMIVGGFVVATSRPVYRVIAWLAQRPRNARQAIAMVAVFAMLSSWFNWGFSLIFSAMLAKEVARKIRGVDYRALAASAFLGLGSVWAQGLSGSAALQMSSAQAMPLSIRTIVAAGDKVPGGVIPLTNTIFLWQSLFSVGIELLIVTALMVAIAPSPKHAKSAADLGIDLGKSPLEEEQSVFKPTPGEWLEHQPWLSIAMVAIAGGYLVHYFWTSTKGWNALTINTINLLFLTLGLALHGTPHRLMKAVKDATPSIWGVILQFPFYAGIAAVLTHSRLSEELAHFFVRISTPTTFPPLIATYSAVLGVFVPSGGSKWVIEAPYVMQAAHQHGVHLGWMVAVYDLGEALANLIQPFWMLPVLGLFRLRAKDVMGYTFLVFLVLAPVVLIMVTVLGRTLSYPL